MYIGGDGVGVGGAGVGGAGVGGTGVGFGVALQPPAAGAAEQSGYVWADPASHLPVFLLHTYATAGAQSAVHADFVSVPPEGEHWPNFVSQEYVVSSHVAEHVAEVCPCVPGVEVHVPLPALPVGVFGSHM